MLSLTGFKPAAIAALIPIKTFSIFPVVSSL